MDIEETWRNDDWTEQARQIITGLKEFPESSKIILILRHSHRNEPKETDKLYKLRLTHLGHEIAKKFGEHLPKNRPIRL